MDELKLLKEIEDLTNEIKTGELVVRDLDINDYDTLSLWWDWWPGWTAPPRDFLPENGKGGLMIEKDNVPIVAGFLYLTNSKTAILDWIVSNPKYKNKDRQEAIEMLIVEAENKVKKLEYKYIFSIGRNKSLINKHKKLDWFVDEKPSYEITKKLK